MSIATMPRDSTLDAVVASFGLDVTSPGRSDILHRLSVGRAGEQHGAYMTLQCAGLELIRKGYGVEFDLNDIYAVLNVTSRPLNS